MSTSINVCVWVILSGVHFFLFYCAWHINPFVGLRRNSRSSHMCVCMCACECECAVGKAISMKAIKHTDTTTRIDTHMRLQGKRTTLDTHTHTHTNAKCNLCCWCCCCCLLWIFTHTYLRKREYNEWSTNECKQLYVQGMRWRNGNCVLYT